MEMQIYDSNVWSLIIKKEILDKKNIKFIDIVNREEKVYTKLCLIKNLV